MTRSTVRRALVAVVAVLVVATGLWATRRDDRTRPAEAQPTQGADPSNSPSPAGAAPTTAGPARVLDEPMQGAPAIAALGDRLDEVAAAYDTTPDELRARFLSDDSMWIDPALKIYFVEPALTPEDATGLAADPAAAAASPQFADPFTLQSRPGSSRVIYLDFDGHVTTGTGWNNNAQLGTGATVTSTAYDSDGDPAAFSSTERALIESVWQRVSEDYAPFDVNVTTADPGNAAIARTDVADQQFGTRVVIAGTNPITTTCGCGGVAFLDAFDDPVDHAYLQPAFVFQATLGGAVATAKTMAEAASHEAGHNFGLSHDGTTSAAYFAGQGPWAPIMGVSYYEPIGQWSRGEYAGANNLEDDLAIISSRGAPLLVDDRGDTLASATPFSGSVAGRITTAADADVYSFVTATLPSVTISGTPSAVSPNLDLKLTLYDALGVELATADPLATQSTLDLATGLDATITRPLTAGTYVVKVEGVGAGSPLTTGYSDYASVGPYVLTVSPVSTPVCVAAPPGAIAWWRGQDSPAAQVGPALNGNPGFADGYVGRGLSFTGSTSATVDGFPTVSDGVSVEAWVKPADTGQVQSLFSRWTWVGGDSDDVFALFAGVNSELLWLTDETSTRSPVGLTAVVPQLYDGLFHHVAATWNRSTTALYVDGQLVASQPSQGGTLNPGAETQFRLGGSGGPGSPLALTGIIDEPAVYGRALSPVEVAGLAAAGSAGRC